MKNKKLLFFIVIIIAAVGLPIWQVKTNSKDLVDGVIKHLSILGAWKYNDFAVDASGVITLQGVHFVPNGHKQGFNINQIRLNSGLKPLLLNYGGSLLKFLPEQLSLRLSGIKMNHNGDDLQQGIGERNFWPLVASDLGAFGCGDNDDIQFSVAQWQQLLPAKYQHDIDFSYSINPNDGYQMAFDFNLITEQSWTLSWSGSLDRGSNDKNIDFTDVSVKKLYYDHFDQGFNKRRNELCAEKHGGSFASYRLVAANRLQKYLRTYATREMSEDLENQYQRTLLENAEIGLEFDFNNPKFFAELAEISRLKWFGDSSTKASLGENQYQELTLQAIDHLDLNMDLLREQMQAKQQLEQIEEQKKQVPEPKKEPVKTIVHHIGGDKPKKSTAISDWSTAVGKRVTIKTKKGKPLTGVLIDANPQYLSIRTRFAQGKATLNIGRENILSVTVKK